jgi:long-chain acyl-CoA synthetase
MNVADQIRRAVRRYGPLPAAICGSESRSFIEIDDRANRLANALTALGIRKGDRVATLVENSVRCVEIDFALAKAGFVRVSLNPRSTAKDVAYILGDSQARALLFGGGFGSLLAGVDVDPDVALLRVEEGEGRASDVAAAIDYEQALDAASDADADAGCDPEDLYCLFYTSGTTGQPKGVMLSHRSILHVSYNLLMEIGPREPGEKILLMQPMSHGAGFFVLPWFMRGGASVIMRHFEPQEVLRLTSELAIETVKLVPTMLQRILKLDAADTPTMPALRYFVYGASPMPAEVTRKAVARFGKRFIQIYGQSEAPVTLSILRNDDHDPDSAEAGRLASAGMPFETVEMRIVDSTGKTAQAGESGEVVLRAPQLMLGYWNRPEQTSETIRDGWLYTRDLGRLDEHGYLYLLGRMDEMIISGGYNIAPREIEEALYLHPAIHECAVVGEPDEEWGNAVVAYVALRDAVEESEIIDFARAQLGFKRPKRIYRVIELPKNPNGKIQKSALKPDLAMQWEGVHS